MTGLRDPHLNAALDYAAAMLLDLGLSPANFEVYLSCLIEAAEQITAEHPKFDRLRDIVRSLKGTKAAEISRCSRDLWELRQTTIELLAQRATRLSPPVLEKGQV